mmetsp:Transcript_47751/g.113634  ORF Transcript_47751/g.113634 Transcript_47751/m.113634 type:complete len:461 (-) Transcript_47751:90-1472(-)
MRMTERGAASVAATLVISCACVLATPAQPSTGFCASPAIGTFRNLRGRAASCLLAPSLTLLPSRVSRGRARQCVIRAQENRGKDSELSKEAETMLGVVAADQTREEALRDKLARWKKKAEEARMADPDSATARATALDPTPSKVVIPGSRGVVFNRMRDLKISERKNELFLDVRQLQKEEEEASRSGSETKEDRREAMEQGVASFAKSNPVETIASLDTKGIENRPNEKITAKLEAWRKRSAEQRTGDSVQVGFNIFASILNAVAFLIGLPIGLLTGKWIDLPEVWEDTSAAADMASVEKKQANIRAFYGQLDGLREGMRAKWRKSASLSGGLPGMAQDAARAEKPDAVVEMQRMKARKARRNEVASELAALVAGDDSEGITLLFRQLFDDSDVAGWLPVGGGEALLAAAAKGQRRAAEALLAAGCDASVRDSDGKSAADLAREAGHDKLALLLGDIVSV